MQEIIGVRLSEGGRVYSFDANGINAEPGDWVVVDTANGAAIGRVADHPVKTPENVEHKPVLRFANTADMRRKDEMRRKEKDAMTVAAQKVAELGLNMNLVDAVCSFEESKILIHFTAESRVDFRQLVKELAGALKARIELRQIGDRDEAKIIGGLGICGRPFCCSTFLGEFHPVSIKMAKEQYLSLNPAKISGTCGRLMCCLKYEEAAYQDANKHLPKIGTTIETPDGPGVISEVNAVSNVITVRLEGKASTPQYYLFVEGEGLQRRTPSALSLSDRIIAAAKADEEESRLTRPQGEPPAEGKRPPKQNKWDRRAGNAGSGSATIGTTPPAPAKPPAPPVAPTPTAAAAQPPTVQPTDTPTAAPKPKPKGKSQQKRQQGQKTEVQGTAKQTPPPPQEPKQGKQPQEPKQPKAPQPKPSKAPKAQTQEKAQPKPQTEVRRANGPQQTGQRSQKPTATPSRTAKQSPAPTTPAARPESESGAVKSIPRYGKIERPPAQPQATGQADTPRRAFGTPPTDKS
ncbi:MAG: hypothetical protein LBR73_07315 [Oscillospiraceae bacterium]|jgi:cell fate regulator YaaT (PSP1 superfamily)|nr:hypothetical protein [Oscillospiraceae bacterium]